ncbi:MAG: ATP-grasp domain-containing protein [Gemmatimonadales bacterium]|nr:ATP-grasp domain-containing protein [Gemmatimonadales bacterium]
MRIAVVFDTPYTGWTAERHRKQMQDEMAGTVDVPDVEVEYQVTAALEANGHETLMIGVYDDLRVVLDACLEWKPDLVVNCAEAFRDPRNDYVFPALLDSIGVRYTGSPAQGLLVSRDKAMSKKVLAYHGIRVPGFTTFRLGETVSEAPTMPFPLIVKPLSSDASVGIAQASVVNDVASLAERVGFVHQRYQQPAIVEEFVAGRELYAGVLGNGPGLQVLPLTELVFDKEMNAPEERIATSSTKWDEPYRLRRRIRYQFARPVSAAAREQIEWICRTACRALWLCDYARIDVRLTDNDEVWVLEANANPYISEGHEFANSAEKIGLDYHQLIERIVTDAMARYANA